MKTTGLKPLPTMAEARYFTRLIHLTRNTFLEYCKIKNTTRIDLRPLGTVAAYAEKDIAWKNEPDMRHYDFMQLYNNEGKAFILFQTCPDCLKKIYRYLKEQSGTATVRIRVTYPHLVWKPGGNDRYELRTFIYRANAGKSMNEQGNDAFAEACKRGHNPNKNIRMVWMDGSPLKAPDGDEIELEMKSESEE